MSGEGGVRKRSGEASKGKRHKGRQRHSHVPDACRSVPAVCRLVVSRPALNWCSRHCCTLVAAGPWRVSAREGRGRCRTLSSKPSSPCTSRYDEVVLHARVVICVPHVFRPLCWTQAAQFAASSVRRCMCVGRVAGERVARVRTLRVYFQAACQAAVTE